MARREAPALPRRLRIGHTTWTVSYDKRETEALGSNGHTMEDHRQIALRPGLVPDKEREVVVHETLHACCAAAALGLDVDTEERLVSNLAGPVLDLIRSNPALLTYLTSKD